MDGFQSTNEDRESPTLRVGRGMCGGISTAVRRLVRQHANDLESPDRHELGGRDVEGSSYSV